MSMNCVHAMPAGRQIFCFYNYTMYEYMYDLPLDCSAGIALYHVIAKHAVILIYVHITKFCL